MKKRKPTILGMYHKGLDAIGLSRAAMATHAVSSTPRVSSAAVRSVATQSSASPSVSASSAALKAATQATPAPTLNRFIPQEPLNPPTTLSRFAPNIVSQLNINNPTGQRMGPHAAAAAAAASKATAAAGAKVKSAGQNIIAIAQKWSKHHPAGGKKLLALGQRMLAGATAPKVATKIKGDLTFAEQASTQNAYTDQIRALGALTNAANAVVTMANIGNQMNALTQQMQTQMQALQSQQLPTGSTALMGAGPIMMTPSTGGVVSTTPNAPGVTTTTQPYGYPYGGTNPYGNPYGANPYGTDPYGNSYGTTGYAQPQVNLQPLTDAINSGSSLLNQMNLVITSFSDDPTSQSFDPTVSDYQNDPASYQAEGDSVTQQANTLASQGQAWLASAQATMQQFASGTMQQSSIPFNSGAGGGGYGGGGDDGSGDNWPGDGSDDGGGPADQGGDSEDNWPEGDAALSDQDGSDGSGESDLQKFRQSGGDYDPFADTGDDSGDGSDSSLTPDDAAYWAGDAASDLDNSDASGDTYAPDDMLGVDFKWQYIFAPWQVEEDKNNDSAQAAKDAAAAHEASMAMSSSAAQSAVQASLNAGLVSDSGVPDMSTTPSSGRLNAARRTLAKAKARRAAYAASKAQENADSNASASDDVLGNYFETSEAPDIMLEQYEQQITDEEPDPMRTHASVHRGAAYLQDHNYPPGGASSGQEGGTMRPEQKIEVFGAYVAQQGSHYMRGLDAISGATSAGRQLVSPRAGFVKSKNPHGLPQLVFSKVKPGDHKTSIANAKDASKRAISIGKKLLTLANKMPKTKVHGAVTVKKKALAAAKAKTIKHTPMTVAQIKKIANAAISAGNKLAAQAKKHENLVNAQAAKAAAAQAAINKSLSKAALKAVAKYNQGATTNKLNATSAAHMAARPFTSTSARTMSLRSATPAATSAAASSGLMSHLTTMFGDDSESMHNYMDAYCEVLGDELPHPYVPGILRNGNPDPNYASDVTIFGFMYTDPATGQTIDSTTGLPAGYGAPGTIDPTTGLPYTSSNIDPTTGLPYDTGTTGGYAADPSDPPDPNRPGYLMSGKLDPSFGVGADVANDPQVMQYQQEIADLPPMPKSLSDAYAAPYNFQPGVDYTQDPVGLTGQPDSTMYTPASYPLGSIGFDNNPSISGSSGGQSIFASLNRYSGSNGPGFEFTDGSWHKIGKDGGRQDISAAENADLNQASVNNSWGPIIGRPGDPNFKDLRFVTLQPGASDANQQVAGGTVGLFWFFDKAPERVKSQLEAARIQQAITDWQTDAATLQSQLAGAVYQAQVNAEQAVATQQQQALEDAQQQRQYDQENAQNQHQVDMDAAAEQAAETAAYQQDQDYASVQAQQNQSSANLDADMYQRASQISDEEQQRQDQYDLSLAQQLDQASASDGGSDDGSSDDGSDALPPQYMEDAAENEGGGDAYDSGNLDEYTDSDYVDADPDAAMDNAPEEPYDQLMGETDDEKREKAKAAARAILDKVLKKTQFRGEDDIDVFGTMTAAQKEKLQKYLKKILKGATPFMGDWEQGEGGANAWQHGEGAGWRMDMDDVAGAPAGATYPRTRGADRIRARRSARR